MSLGKKARGFLIALAGLLLLGLGGYGLYAVMHGKTSATKKPPKISLIPTTPPPPPPPPKEEKKVEPPKEQKEMKMDQPVQKAEAPAPAPELKMEGTAGDGPSAFASGRVTSEDVSKIGGDKGVGGAGKGLFNPFASYSNSMKSELQRYLARIKDLRRRTYSADVQVWVAADGSIKRVELNGSSGDEQIDEALRQSLANAPGFTDPPPANMPQPIRIRIVTSGRS